MHLLAPCAVILVYAAMLLVVALSFPLPLNWQLIFSRDAWIRPAHAVKLEEYHEARDYHSETYTFRSYRIWLDKDGEMISQCLNPLYRSGDYLSTR